MFTLSTYLNPYLKLLFLNVAIKEYKFVLNTFTTIFIIC